MRITLLTFLAACGGGGGLPPPDDCGPGELHFVHDLDNGAGEGFETISSFLFVNAINGENGNLAVGMDGTTQIVVEFPELLFSDGTVSARGRVQTTGIAAGNCETGSFSGELSQGKTSAGTDMWSFTLVDLHAEPFCGGAAISGSFAACVGSTSD